MEGGYFSSPGYLASLDPKAPKAFRGFGGYGSGFGGQGVCFGLEGPVVLQL